MFFIFTKWYSKCLKRISEIPTNLTFLFQVPLFWLPLRINKSDQLNGNWCTWYIFCSSCNGRQFLLFFDFLLVLLTIEPLPNEPIQCEAGTVCCKICRLHVPKLICQKQNFNFCKLHWMGTIEESVYPKNFHIYGIHTEYPTGVSVGPGSPFLVWQLIW